MDPNLFGQSLIGFKLQCVGRSLVLLSIQQETHVILSTADVILFLFYFHIFILLSSFSFFVTQIKIPLKCSHCKLCFPLLYHTTFKISYNFVILLAYKTFYVVENYKISFVNVLNLVVLLV